MKLVIFVIMLLHGRFHIQCFNIDTKFPIVYSRPKESLPGRNSYFGFSLLLHKDWVVVGAPRANSTILKENVMEPGVAYRCKLFGACTEVELDRNANKPRDDNVAVWDLKNYSWIGGAMAMEYGPNSKVVVCGHRWKNQANLSPRNSKKHSYEYAMSGICYISQSYEGDLLKKFEYTLPPEVYDTRGKDYKGVTYHGLYHKSQLGMSVYITPPSQNSISLLIGAPGAGRYWTGGVLEYMRTPSKPPEARRKRDVQFRPYMKKDFIDEFVFPYIDQFTYFGYQVAAGYFFSKKKLFHVAGAPRADNLKGLVAVYSVHYGLSPQILHFNVKKGHSFGEYFGSSLAVADVTGDGLDDLIVGAPFFSLHGDEGCIYVFTKHASFEHESQDELYEKERKVGFKIGGRFGTALASLGDIDQDGMDDIAVGAPYEESGVIYIYNGTPKGLSSKPSQQIKASNIHSSISGFGISISRPADIDGNKFTDVAVGSYLSENVVLLRSYPVIELHAYLESSIEQFNMSHTKFIVKACLRYTGSENVPTNIGVVRKLDVDIKFHRFKPLPTTKHVLTRINESLCDSVTIEKMEESDDSIYNDLSDITIFLSQSLSHQENHTSRVLWANDSSTFEDADKFCRSCPVVRRIIPHEISIPYARECGEECVSDAQLICRLMQNDTVLNGYIIGSSPTIKLTVNVRNKGDTLYSPKVKINIPKEIDLARIPLTCQDLKGSQLVVACNFGRINNGEMKSVNISLDLSSFETLRSLSEKGLPLLINVNISKDNYKDPNETNNHCNMKLNLIMKADVNITGKSDGDVFFSKNDRKESSFTHIYEVSNVGISPIRRVSTFFYIPFEWHGSGSPVQFSDPSIEARQNGRSIFCNLAERNLTFDQNVYQKGVKKEHKDISLSDSHPSNRTLYVNCSSPNVKCKAWKCNFIEFKHNTIAKIVIVVKLNVSKLVPVMGHKDIIYFSSHGHVEMLESKNTQRPDIKTYHDITVSSAAIGTVTDEKIQLWIIILCIIIGILLMAAIITGLAKAGFFKRDKKEELQALKNSEN